MGAPEIEPIVRRTAAEGSGSVRDVAWMRLLEFDPDSARALVIDRVLRGDVTSESAALLIQLPAALLPEMDEALVAALDDGLPVALLIARYSSPDVYPRVRAIFESQGTTACSPLIAYFARVDAPFAEVVLDRARSMNVPCPLSVSSRLMSPGLERMAIRDLDDEDEPVWRAAHALLRRAGSENGKQALVERLDGVDRAAAGERVSDRVTSILYTLLHGNGWALLAEEFDRLASACREDPLCRGQVSSARQMLDARPLRLDINDGFGPGEPAEFSFDLGPWENLTFAQLSDRLTLFEPDTTFALREPAGHSWHRAYYMSRIEQRIEEAGMRLVGVQ